MLHFFQLFIFGFISSFFIGRVLIQGWLGQGLKNKTEYILSNKFVFNTSFILFTIFYFLIVIQMHYSIISLDPSDKIAVSMDGVQVEVSGILEIAKVIGPQAAFVTGTKIACAFLSKTKMGLLPKIGTTLATGSVFAVGSVATIEGIEILRYNMRSKVQSTNQISVHIENLKCNVDTNVVSNKCQDFLSQAINTDLLASNNNTTKFSPELVQALKTLKNNFNSNAANTNNNIQSKVLEELGKTHEDIASIFAKGVEVKPHIDPTLIDTFINSPLEPAKLDLIISVLNKGLILHYCMLYLISTLFFVFTIKLIADRDLYTPYWQGKIQSLPLGNTINNLLIRLIKIWKVSNILWIYFMMGSLLIAICFSTFAVYASLAGLQG